MTDAIDDCLRPYSAAGQHRLLGRAASRAAFAQESLADYAVVQLMLHQIEGRDEDDDAGLLFDDGVRWRRELQDRRCGGLVIVSACGAGRGPRRVGEGEGFHSFVGTFLWNGAQAAIASRHDLLAEDHIRMMAHCHAELARGASPASAMRAARQAMAANSTLQARVQRAMVQVFGAGQQAVVAR